MRLVEFLDVLFEGKAEKLAATFGKKLLQRWQADQAVPRQIRMRIARQQPLEQVPLNIINYLAQYDKTTSKKYLQWMVTQYVRGALELEDAYKFPEMFQSFEKHAQSGAIQQRNIEQYKDYRQLQKEIFDIEDPGGTAARSTGIQTFLERPDVQEGLKQSEIVYQSPRLLVVAPKSRAASCALGKGTKWCVAASESTNYFDHYMKQGQLYFAYNDKGEKFGIHFETGNFMDVQDNPVPVVDTIKANPEMLAAFNPDQISIAAAKDWKEGWGEGARTISGAESFMTLWRDMNFTPTPKGQMRLAEMSPLSIIQLDQEGFPVAPEGHAVALERAPYMGGLTQEQRLAKAQIIEYYMKMAQGGEIPASMRLALVANGKFEKIATPEEIRQLHEIQETDIDDRPEALGTISQNYEKYGLTPVLLARINDAADERGGEPPFYSPSTKHFVVRIFDDMQEAADELALGDDVGYALRLDQGEEHVEVHETPQHDMLDDVVTDHLSDDNVYALWKKMFEEIDELLQAIVEWHYENGMELPLVPGSDPEDNEVDYDAAMKNNLYPDGYDNNNPSKGIDRNFVLEILNQPGMEDIREGANKVAGYVWMSGAESGEQADITDSLMQYARNGVEGYLGNEYPVELFPRDMREYIHMEEPFLLKMAEKDFIRLMDGVESGEEYDYPEWDSNDLDMDKHSYTNWGYSEPDSYVMQENWGEYLYMMGKDER